MAFRRSMGFSKVPDAWCNKIVDRGLFDIFENPITCVFYFPFLLLLSF